MNWVININEPLLFVISKIVLFFSAILILIRCFQLDKKTKKNNYNCGDLFLWFLTIIFICSVLTTMIIETNFKHELIMPELKEIKKVNANFVNKNLYLTLKFKFDMNNYILNLKNNSDISIINHNYKRFYPELIYTGKKIKANKQKSIYKVKSIDQNEFYLTFVFKNRDFGDDNLILEIKENLEGDFWRKRKINYRFR